MGIDNLNDYYDVNLKEDRVKNLQVLIMLMKDSLLRNWIYVI